MRRLMRPRTRSSSGGDARGSSAGYSLACAPSLNVGSIAGFELRGGAGGAGSLHSCAAGAEGSALAAHWIEEDALTETETLHRVKLVLRDCLKLGPEAVITDEMPLVGGVHDLDSLDILLIVTSMEKEFGIKIPNESVGRAAFATVSTLAGFVDSMRGGK